MWQYVPYYVYLMMLCAAVAIIRFRKLNTLPRLFVPFLLLSIFVELATPLQLLPFRGGNHWFFNLFTTVEFLFLGFVYYKALHATGQKRFVLYSLAAGILFTIINFIFIQGFWTFHTISYRIFSLAIITWCLMYFRQLMQTEEEVFLLKNPMFWLSTGLFFFCLGLFFYMTAFDYIVYNNVSYNGRLWEIISDAFNWLLYVCFLIAFLCPETKTASFNLSS